MSHTPGPWEKGKYCSCIVHAGDCLDVLKMLPSRSVSCCVTSPPYYGLRDYGMESQIGLEDTPEEYIDRLVSVFQEVRRVLRDDGTLWLNLGDSYSNGGGDTYSGFNERYDGTGAGGKQSKTHNHFRKRNVPSLPPKNLIGIPWRVALALQSDGWVLRQDIIWNKPNPMPESMTDRCTKAHEYIFLLAKSGRYYFDNEAIREKSVESTKGKACSFKREGSKRGVPICPRSPSPSHRADRENISYDGELRNRRSVWEVASRPFSGAHFAVFPEKLIEPCVLAGSPPGGVVLDPFCGSGTTGVVAARFGRDFVGVELNPEYVHMARERIGAVSAQGRLFREVDA